MGVMRPYIRLRQGVNAAPPPVISRTCDRIAFNVRKPEWQFGVSPVSPFMRRI